jgi:hypothetical protein
MDVCVYSVFVLSCVSIGLATGWSLVQGVLPTVYKCKITEPHKEEAKARYGLQPHIKRRTLNDNINIYVTMIHPRRCFRHTICVWKCLYSDPFFPMVIRSCCLRKHSLEPSTSTSEANSRSATQEFLYENTPKVTVGWAPFVFRNGSPELKSRPGDLLT